MLGLDVEKGSGGLTKYNRTRLGLPKEHYYDAACVGRSTPGTLSFKTADVLIITARGRGSHQRTNVNASGFPRGYLARQKYFFGFKSGDLIRSDIPKGKYTGHHEGIVLCRKTGSFDIRTASGRIQGINQRYCHILQRADGYGYHKQPRSAAASPWINPGASAA